MSRHPVRHRVDRRDYQQRQQGRTEQPADDNCRQFRGHQHPFTKTDRYPARLEARAKKLGVSLEEAEASFTANFPIGRIVEPEDIAPAILFLASPHASAITGQALAVDGGSTPYVAY